MASFIRKFGGQNGHDENASNNEGWKPGTRTAEPNSETITTNTGLPVWEHKFSETLGRDGPVMLEDYQLLEKLSQFDRERIPERVVHAQGYAAKGYFEVTHDITHLTCARVFSEVGKRTPVTTRFSTVIHPRGSSEGLRDPRGFSVKFYTEDGNWDLVGNNIPVFFVQDGMLFPDLIHALKPDPVTNVQEGWRIADFFSHLPESMHMFSFVYDDAGIPANFRVMDGFGVNTFRLVTSEGHQTLVKFHWRSLTEGPRYMSDEDAIYNGGKNAVFASNDLFNAIDSGNYPQWDFLIQTMSPEEAETLEFNPLDVTKDWPESRFPLQPVGRMTLDRNVSNFFNESEMLAFSPALVVPGIAFTEDRMLQTRLFSYADTTRYRLGVNYLQIPINAPKSKVNPVTTQEGQMQMFDFKGNRINYYPSSLLNDASAHGDAQPVSEAPSNVASATTQFSNLNIEGKRTREDISKRNHFQQPGDRYRWFDPARRDRFINRIAEKVVGGPKVTKEIRERWFSYFDEMDPEAGQKLRKAVEGMAQA